MSDELSAEFRLAISEMKQELLASVKRMLNEHSEEERRVLNDKLASFEEVFAQIHSMIERLDRRLDATESKVSYIVGIGMGIAGVLGAAITVIGFFVR